jgi:hypothetical protein
MVVIDVGAVPTEIPLVRGQCAVRVDCELLNVPSTLVCDVEILLHGMTSVGSLLSGDFTCNPSVTSVNGILQQWATSHFVIEITDACDVRGN